MNPAAHRNEDNASAPVLYMALELSNKNWRLTFGGGGKRRHPMAPGLSLAGVRLIIPDHALGLPVLRALSLCTCCRHYPGAATGGTASLIHPVVSAFPGMWAVTMILSGGTTIMMAGGEESKAA